MSALAKRSVTVTAGFAVRPIAGETTSGDLARVVPHRRGVIALLADGLGHGSRAATAADAFAAIVARNVDRRVDELFLLAHKALVPTRGAVAAIARFDEVEGKVELAALGNIAMLYAPATGSGSHRPATPGIVGGAYRTIRPETLAFGLGDVLVLHSDGVRGRVDVRALRGLSPQAAAMEIVRRSGKPGDDAAALVARGVAPAPPRDVVAPSAAESGKERVTLSIRRVEDAAVIAVETRAFAERAGLSLRASWEASIAVAELCTNVAKYAGEGRVTLRAAQQGGIEIEVVDRGAGIGDGEAAPRRAGHGLGLGLGTVRRMMDEVTIDSALGVGTRVVARKLCKPNEGA